MLVMSNSTQERQQHGVRAQDVLTHKARITYGRHLLHIKLGLEVRLGSAEGQARKPVCVDKLNTYERLYGRHEAICGVRSISPRHHEVV